MKHDFKWFWLIVNGFRKYKTRYVLTMNKSRTKWYVMKTWDPDQAMEEDTAMLFGIRSYWSRKIHDYVYMLDEVYLSEAQARISCIMHGRRDVLIGVEDFGLCDDADWSMSSISSYLTNNQY